MGRVQPCSGMGTDLQKSICIARWQLLVDAFKMRDTVLAFALGIVEWNRGEAHPGTERHIFRANERLWHITAAGAQRPNETDRVRHSRHNADHRIDLNKCSLVKRLLNIS